VGEESRSVRRADSTFSWGGEVVNRSFKNKHHSGARRRLARRPPDNTSGEFESGGAMSPLDLEIMRKSLRRDSKTERDVQLLFREGRQQSEKRNTARWLPRCWRWIASLAGRAFLRKKSAKR